MKLLAEIFRNESINIDGRKIIRNAVRGIIIDQDKLFMIYSKVNGDYKFPGGGLKNGEDRESALMREIKEETGVKVVEVGAEFGHVVEYDLPIEPEYDVFKMTSRYFVCKIGHEFGEQMLDPYEEDLGFTAQWVGIEAAINSNKALLGQKNMKIPRWIKREVIVLEHIRNNLSEIG